MIKSVLRSILPVFFGGVIASVFTIVIVAGLVAVALSEFSGDDPTRPPGGDIVLTLDLRESVPDMSQLSAVPFFRETGFVDIISRLHGAASDDAVRGVFVRVGYFGPGVARAEELRSAFQALQAKGKFVVAHAQGFGIGPSGYQAVSTADQIVLQPGSDFSVSGLMLETLFLRDLFEKIDVVPDMIAVGKYKNAPNTYTESDFTGPHAEALRTLGNSIWETSLTAIASDRGLTMFALRELMAASPHSGVDALSNGLVDSLSWPEETLQAALEHADQCPDVCAQHDINSYQPPEAGRKAPVIALVGGGRPNHHRWERIGRLWPARWLCLGSGRA